MSNDLQRIKEGLKCAVLDIESTGLKADWGYIICASLKEVNSNNLSGKTITLRTDDYRNQETDEQLTKDLAKEMDKYDLLLTWYGSQFDHRFINARCGHNRTPYPMRIFRRDLCFVSRANYALTGHSLANVSRFMFGKTEKTRTDFEIWLGAMRGDKRKIQYLVDHCEIDVAETEKVYKKMIPLMGRLRRG